jgi:hypothetical protein
VTTSCPIENSYLIGLKPFTRLVTLHSRCLHSRLLLLAYEAPSHKFSAPLAQIPPAPPNWPDLLPGLLSFFHLACQGFLHRALKMPLCPLVERIQRPRRVLSRPWSLFLTATLLCPALCKTKKRRSENLAYLPPHRLQALRTFDVASKSGRSFSIYF